MDVLAVAVVAVTVVAVLVVVVAVEGLGSRPVTVAVMDWACFAPVAVWLQGRASGACDAHSGRKLGARTGPKPICPRSRTLPPMAPAHLCAQDPCALSQDGNR